MLEWQFTVLSHSLINRTKNTTITGNYHYSKTILDLMKKAYFNFIGLFHNFGAPHEKILEMDPVPRWLYYPIKSDRFT